MVRNDFPRLTLCYVPRTTTSFNQPLDRAYFKAFKANVTRQFCADLATEVINSSNPIGQLVRRPVLRLHALAMLTAAVAAAHTEERLHAAWKHLLLQDGDDVATLVAEAEAERVAGRLFENGEAAAEEGLEGQAEEEEYWMREAEDEPAMGDELLVDWVPDEMASELAPPWQDDGEPLPGVEAVPPVAASEPAHTQTSLPESHVRLNQMSRWLALRLAYGTASKKELAMTIAPTSALPVPSTSAPSEPRGGSSSTSSSSGLQR